MGRQPLVYADACIFLNVIKKEPGLWPDSLKILLAAERDDIRVVASTLLLAELTGWRGDVDASRQVNLVEQYLERLDTLWVEVDYLTVRDARGLAQRFRLRGADAVHLATATRSKADFFVTRDDRFPIGLDVGGTKIIRPEIVWDPTTDDEAVDQKAAEEFMAG